VALIGWCTQLAMHQPMASRRDFVASNITEVLTGMQGIDIAFYKNRAKYHTPLDSVAEVEGGRHALWAMIDTARAVGVGLLNSDGDSNSAVSSDGAVWFDCTLTLAFCSAISRLHSF
jgi:hypothetical protein